MGQEVGFISSQHNATRRDYLSRVVNQDKAACARIARQFGYDYWDGDRAYGYGGYHYDGRWLSLANRLTQHYQLKAGHKVLDVGCGKGFLLHELQRLTPGLQVVALDLSSYALHHCKEEIHPARIQAHANRLPFADNTFDFVFSINTLHNLYCFDMMASLQEMQRVTKQKAYLVVESYRNEEEKVNLMYWQLTCECFFTPQEWTWWFGQSGFAGDYEFIYFS